MDKYYKNFILCGEVDYYCLICQETFIMIEEVDKHLRWQNHRRDVKDQEYVPKFRKDFIYKIKDHFYCEICNLVPKSLTEHIKNDSHILLKTSNNVALKSSTIKRASNGALKINNITITKHQWHSIIDNQCLLCNEPVEKPFSHFANFIHIIKLIQSETLCEDNQYYRKITPGKYYCFTCYKVFETSLDTHVISHKDIKSLKTDVKKPDTSKKSKDTNNNEGSVIMKILIDIHKEDFNFDKESNTATCKICKEIVKADFRPVSEHSAIHKTPDFIFVDSGKRRADLKIYGKQNYIKLNEGGSKGFCSLCNMEMSGHINVFKQHVEGSIHQGYLELKGLIKNRKHEKPPQKGVPFKRFLECKFGPFHIDNFDVVVINDGICLEILSFTLINFVENFNGITGKCFVCDIALSVGEIAGHAMSKEHINLFNACTIYPMEAKGHKEFIRQIRPGLFHCGSCNKIFPFWENRHLKSRTHDYQRVKKGLLSSVCAKTYLNPLLPLEAIEEYVLLRKLDGFK